MDSDSSVTKKRPAYLRFLALALSSLLLVGGYYSYDNPAYLNVKLQSWLGSDDITFQYQLATMYSVYSIPNIFLPMLGGLFIDSMGSRKLIIFFSLLICGGQACFALSTEHRFFPGMLVGRVLLGIGVESLGVAQTTFITSWFKGKECAFAIGFNLCVARLGNVMNDNLTPMIASRVDVPTSLWLSFLLCLTSFVCACLAVMMDSCGIRAPKRSISVTVNNCEYCSASAPLAYQKRCSSASSVSITSPLLGGRRMRPPLLLKSSQDAEEKGDGEFQQHSSNSNICCPGCSRPIMQGSLVDDPTSSERISLADIRLFGAPFWVLCACMICFYGSTMPFTNIAAQVLETKWGLDGEQSGSLMAVTDTLSAITLPLFGYLVDTYGKRTSLLVLTGLLIGSIHVMVGFVPQVPVLVPLVILGFCYGMFASAFWSSISLLVPARTVATAYGIATGALNGALSIVPIIVAYFVGLDQQEFAAVEAFFTFLVAVGIACAIWLGRLDRMQGSLLQLPEPQSSPPPPLSSTSSPSSSTNTFDTPRMTGLEETSHLLDSDSGGGKGGEKHNYGSFCNF